MSTSKQHSAIASIQIKEVADKPKSKTIMHATPKGRPKTLQKFNSNQVIEKKYSSINITPKISHQLLKFESKQKVGTATVTNSFKNLHNKKVHYSSTFVSNISTYSNASGVRSNRLNSKNSKHSQTNSKNHSCKRRKSLTKSFKNESEKDKKPRTEKTEKPEKKKGESKSLSKNYNSFGCGLTKNNFNSSTRHKFFSPNNKKTTQNSFGPSKTRTTKPNNTITHTIKKRNKPFPNVNIDIDNLTEPSNTVIQLSPEKKTDTNFHAIKSTKTSITEKKKPAKVYKNTINAIKNQSLKFNLTITTNSNQSYKRSKTLLPSNGQQKKENPQGTSVAGCTQTVKTFSKYNTNSASFKNPKINLTNHNQKNYYSNGNSIYHNTNNPSLGNSISSSNKAYYTGKNLYLNNSCDNFSFSSSKQTKLSISTQHTNNNNSLKSKIKIKVNRKQVQNTLPLRKINFTINNISTHNTLRSESRKRHSFKNGAGPPGPKKILVQYRKYLVPQELKELKEQIKEVYYLGEIRRRKQNKEVTFVNTNKSFITRKPKLYIETLNKKDIVKRNKSYGSLGKDMHYTTRVHYCIKQKYDDPEGDYKINKGDQLNYRYQIISLLGKGSFGEAVKCLDHKTNEYVCIKIIKSNPKFHPQAKIEIKILQHIKDHDKNGESGIVKLYSHFTFRNHICLVFELLDINLYEYIKSKDYVGIQMKKIRAYCKEILFSLLFLKKQKIIHCDLKPENILLVKNNKDGVKVIDFGSSCFEKEKLYAYIQSRFYRAPEILLDQGYGIEIDMWSLGCILCELYTGIPIFPGEDERDQLNYIMEYLDVPPSDYINMSRKKNLFFDENCVPYQIPNSNGKIRIPKTKSFHQFLKGASENFIDFIQKCLKWDPDYRMTPEEGLLHKFICCDMTHDQLIQHKQKIKRILN